MTQPDSVPPPLPFRVHFADGTKLDVYAADAVDAKKAAQKRGAGIITKIKRNRENGQ